MREYGLHTRFIELAGSTRPCPVVVQRLAEVLDQRSRIGLNGARVLVLGIAYKKNVDDMRESRALKLIELLKARGATVTFHDPFLPEIHRRGAPGVHGHALGRAHRDGLA